MVFFMPDWQKKQANSMKIIEVQQKYENFIMQLPNVTGMGIGLKQDESVIKVFVSKKLPKDCLQPGEIIPKTLDGYPTDVEEIGIVTAQHL